MLIRDPSKRLGAVRDAEEIKQHVFFKGVDWDVVYKKGLRPPKPVVNQLPSTRIPAERMFGEMNCADSCKVKSWSFVNGDNL